MSLIAPAPKVTASPDGAGFVVVGCIAGLHGLQGGLKVYSYTRPAEGILEYTPWYLYLGGAWRAVVRTDAYARQKRLIAYLEGFCDVDSATGLVGADIAVRRAQLRPLPDGEHYWRDLIGLEAYTPSGQGLGKVVGMLDTGANDVLIVRGERDRLVPYVEGVYVRSVDLANRRLELDWDLDD
ncbi:MAG: ribosome maturation factor RimM [Beggiatoa sp.]|nr:ribosome maturation factor RimM [Beggiatoa sp.]